MLGEDHIQVNDKTKAIASQGAHPQMTESKIYMETGKHHRTQENTSVWFDIDFAVNFYMRLGEITDLH